MKRILIVEDDGIIARNNFDLAILDMQLPDGAGFDVREKLLNTETAVIFLTVVDDQGAIKAMESDCL